MYEYYWLIAALVLGIVEVTIGANFFLMWCALSALFVAAMAFLFPLTLNSQLILFSIVTLAVLLVWQKYKPKFMNKQPKTLLNQRANQYLHREFYLEEPIINGVGKVKVDDASWRVEGPNLPQGTKVIVIAVEGSVLKVKELEKNN